MAVQQVFHVTNVVVPAAPPTVFAPNSSGAAVPAGGISWTLLVDSAGYSAGSSADMTVQYQYGGVWTDDVGVTGFTLGTFTGKTGPTTVNSVNSSIGISANPYPSNVRLKIDRIPAGTIASITVNVQ